MLNKKLGEDDIAQVARITGLIWFLVVTAGRFIVNGKAGAITIANRSKEIEKRVIDKLAEISEADNA